MKYLYKIPAITENFCYMMSTLHDTEYGNFCSPNWNFCDLYTSSINPGKVIMHEKNEK